MSGGAVVSAGALLIVLVMLPLARRWATREDALRASREQLNRLQVLVASENRLRRALDERNLAYRAASARLIAGTTPALAGSNLQVLLQRFADESAVQLDRVDVVGEPKADQSGLLAVPARFQGRGDIYGLVDFLYRIERGEKLLVIDELNVNAPFWISDTRQTLVWSVRLHGLHSASEAGP